MFELSELKKQLLDTMEHALVLGGPGSGKTTIALIKARHEILNYPLKSQQKILFLSFARATISRVEEQLSGLKVTREMKNSIEINTYHGFTWEMIKAHGYLLNGFRRIRLLTPPEASSHFAEIMDKEKIEIEKKRLFYDKGLLHFDLFAELCYELLANSEVLTSIICNSYPIIILDEFQDTNLSEWQLIKRLGVSSRIIALADDQQRIYEFRGADPARIKDFKQFFRPKIFDFGSENNRSNGTDIVKFGNDLLTGEIGMNSYNDVEIIYYQNIKNVHFQVKQLVLTVIQRLNKTSKQWSLAILVPSKQLMLNVSDCLSQKQIFKSGKTFPIISHEVALEKDALALSAILIAGLIEKGEADLEIKNRLISHLIDYIRGRKGAGKISKVDLELSKALSKYIETGKVQGQNRILLIRECIRISQECSNAIFSGNPTTDWLIVRDIIAKSNCDILNLLVQDAMYLRLLHRGSVLQNGLANLWRERGNYTGAMLLVRNALLQEHFSKTATIPNGIQVMTIHKAKGKEFDEVIIYEGIYSGRIVRDPKNQSEINKSQLLLRVAVTRAMKKASILTPEWDKCILLK